MSVADKIREMAELREQGLISETEFQAEKDKLLAGGTAAPQQPQSVTVNVSNHTDASDKEWLICLLLNFFLGYLGVHRFYSGHIIIGVVQLCTFGMCGVWTLIDFILILIGSYTDAQGRPLKR